jgi:hypothetical protein
MQLFYSDYESRIYPSMHRHRSKPFRVVSLLDLPPPPVYACAVLLAGWLDCHVIFGANAGMPVMARPKIKA